MSPTSSCDVKVRRVSVSFSRDQPKFVALGPLDLEIESGHLTAIVGPSGCGKSTLLKVIAGLIAPDHGDVWVDPGRVQKGIAYIPQGASLLPWRTAMQNACLGLEVQTAANSGAALTSVNIAFVNSMFEDWNLTGFENAYPSELSGGMSQRVALIRALASRPSILLCDEPFSAIDFVTRLRLSTEFKRMCKLNGSTTILVTHNIEEAIFLGDLVVVMSGRPGRIVSTYRPAFSRGGNNAVECRVSPEFQVLFQSIWKDLEAHQS